MFFGQNSVPQLQSNPSISVVSLSHSCVLQSQRCPSVTFVSWNSVPQSYMCPSVTVMSFNQSCHSVTCGVAQLQSCPSVSQSQLCPSSRVPQSVSQSVVCLSHRCFTRSHVTKEVVSLLLFLFCTRQNIDSLERVAGVEESRLTEAHGTFHTSHCLSCQKEYSQDWIKGSHLFIDSTSLDTVHPIPV